MKETFEDYLQRLKDRRTEDDYEYTDEDFKKHIHYIFDCYEKDLSVYKCLEFMYFVEREIQPEQIWNEEKMEGIKKVIQKQKLIEIIKSDEDAKIFVEALENIPEPNDKLKKAFRDFGKQETVEEYFLDNIKNVLLFKNDAQAIRFMEKYYHAKKEEEQHDTLPGLIKQFDPKEGEIDEGAWTVSRFLKWLELNKFKIVR